MLLEPPFTYRMQVKKTDVKIHVRKRNGRPNGTFFNFHTIKQK